MHRIRKSIIEGSLGSRPVLLDIDTQEFASLPANFSLVKTLEGIVGAIDLDTRTTAALVWMDIPVEQIAAFKYELHVAV